MLWNALNRFVCDAEEHTRVVDVSYCTYHIFYNDVFNLQYIKIHYSKMTIWYNRHRHRHRHSLAWKYTSIVSQIRYSIPTIRFVNANQHNNYLQCVAVMYLNFAALKFNRLKRKDALTFFASPRTTRRRVKRFGSKNHNRTNRLKTKFLWRCAILKVSIIFAK